MKRILTIAAIAALAMSCSVDLMDNIDKAEDTTESEAVMTVKVSVSGTMISTRSNASSDEMRVDSYDLFIFDENSGSLQYMEKGIRPSMNEKEVDDIVIDKKTVTLPYPGGKFVYAVANPSGMTYPELKVQQDKGDVTATRRANFIAETIQAISAMPAAPFVMAASTHIANSTDAIVPIKLARTVSRIDIVNDKPSTIQINTVQVSGAAASRAIFAASQAEEEVIDLGTVDMESAIYTFPSSALCISVEGTVNGTPASASATLEEMYADYNYKLYVKQNGNSLATKCYPSSGSEVEIPDFEISGEWLDSQQQVILPFTAEPNYGFTIGYTANISGDVSIEKDEVNWFSAEIEGDNTIRIKTLESNSGSQREASFRIKAGRAALNVKVVQQSPLTVGSVNIAGITWMDRNLGAIVPANGGNANNIKAYGYYWQWGRNVPFPTVGEVETVATQMTPAQANASKAFITYTGETQDWNSEGVAGTIDDHWESVSGSDPCPEGWRLPTYQEIAAILPYRQNSLIFANGKQERETESYAGEKFKYQGYGTGAISADTYTPVAINGIMNYGSDQAYYMRWQWTNTDGTCTADAANGNVNYMAGGTNVFRISYIKGNSSSAYASKAAAQTFWDENLSKAEGDLYPVVAGCRNAEGKLQEENISAFLWSGSMFNHYEESTETAFSSGLAYLRPSAKFMFMPAPSYGKATVYYDTEKFGYRNQAFPVRCVKK